MNALNNYIKIMYINVVQYAEKRIGFKFND